MNPYTILDIPPGADNATVAKAMASAMKARRYPAHILADAQRTLLSSERRLLADFLLPVLPAPRRLAIPVEPPLPPTLPAWPHENLDELVRATEAAIARDLALSQAVPGGASLSSFEVTP
ncbi:MAG: hypothetical protein VKP62_02980 [Candidatus Sericytochromatia bacterium]|nr:hypothetical protein [Candidatus Sericytochromatia bacterium]